MSVRVIGIDPGSRITGYGVVDTDGQKMTFVDCGCVNVKGDDLGVRLRCIDESLAHVIETHQPHEFAIEKVFMSRNADAALKLGQARGVAIATAARFSLPFAEYSARQIKQAVVGYGAADKQQVQQMVRSLLRLTRTPSSDAADALAIAICHGHTRQSLLHFPAAKKLVRGRLRR